MLMNDSMKKIYNESYIKHPVNIPINLENIIQEGILEQNGCILFKYLYKKQKIDESKNFPDKTGYECFINKIYIDDFSETPFPVAISVALEVIKKLPQYNIRNIISQDDLSCTFRFHLIRNDEIWLKEDLNIYMEESILIIDSTDTV